MKTYLLLSFVLIAISLAGCEQNVPLNKPKREYASGPVFPHNKKDYCSLTIGDKKGENFTRLEIICFNMVTGAKTYGISTTLLIWGGQ